MRYGKVISSGSCNQRGSQFQQFFDIFLAPWEIGVFCLPQDIQDLSFLEHPFLFEELEGFYEKLTHIEPKICVFHLRVPLRFCGLTTLRLRLLEELSQGYHLICLDVDETHSDDKRVSCGSGSSLVPRHLTDDADLTNFLAQIQLDFK